MGTLSRLVKGGDWNQVFATWVAIAILFLYWCLGFIVVSVNKFCARVGKKRARSSVGEKVSSAKVSSPARSLESSINESELEGLIDELDEVDPGSNWSVVVDKHSDGVSYFAKRREPKDGGPTEYLSTTIFRNCTPELLRDFYMDNEFRLQWDSTVLNHEQLDLCPKSGTEVGHTVKKFPFMMPREYVLAWRLWQAPENTYFCLIKGCEHPAAARRNDYKRVREYLSCWRIRAVADAACEVKMLHREETGVGREMAKMAFARGIWSFVTKMEHNLRRYKTSSSNRKRDRKPDAVTLCNKVSAELERKLSGSGSRIHSQSLGCGADRASRNANECNRPIGLVMQSVFLLGWAVFMSRGSTSIGAKIAAAVFMNKAVQRKQRKLSSRQPNRYVSKSFSIRR